MGKPNGDGSGRVLACLDAELKSQSLEDAMRSRDGVRSLALANAIDMRLSDAIRAAGIGNLRLRDQEESYDFANLKKMGDYLQEVGATLSEIALCGMKEPEDSQPIHADLAAAELHFWRVAPAVGSRAQD